MKNAIVDDDDDNDSEVEPALKTLQRKLSCLDNMPSMITSIAKSKLRGGTASLVKKTEAPLDDALHKVTDAEKQWHAIKHKATLKQFGREYDSMACFVPGDF